MASLQLNQEGIHLVRQAKEGEGWTNMDIAAKAYVCEATVKRFIKGDRVSPGSFKGICRALGLEDWKALAGGSLAVQDGVEAKGAIAVTGIFTEDKRLQIEATLNVLTKLLQDGDVMIHYDGDEPTEDSD